MNLTSFLDQKFKQNLFLFIQVTGSSIMSRESIIFRACERAMLVFSSQAFYELEVRLGFKMCVGRVQRERGMRGSIAGRYCCCSLELQPLH